VWIDQLGIAIGSLGKPEGLIANYVPYFTHPVNKGLLKLKITSPNLDLQDFLVKRAQKRNPGKKKSRQDESVGDARQDIYNA